MTKRVESGSKAATGDGFTTEHDGACGCAECVELDMVEIRQAYEHVPTQPVAECWTPACTYPCEHPGEPCPMIGPWSPYRWSSCTPGRLDALAAERHRAAGHDVRPVRKMSK